MAALMAEHASGCIACQQESPFPINTRKHTKSRSKTMKLANIFHSYLCLSFFVKAMNFHFHVFSFYLLLFVLCQ